MVKLKYIIIVVLVVGAGIFAYNHFFQSEESKIKKRFDLFSKWGSKDSVENKLITANRVNNIKTLFAENCNIQAPAYSVSRNYKPQDISSIALMVLSQYFELSLRFYDIEINIPEKESANAVLTAKLSGKLTTGEYVNEIHELECVLIKIEEDWLFSEIKIVDVLEK
jgi:hypothetical protein